MFTLLVSSSAQNAIRPTMGLSGVGTPVVAPPLLYRIVPPLADVRRPLTTFGSAPEVAATPDSLCAGPNAARESNSVLEEKKSSAAGLCTALGSAGATRRATT